MTAAIVLGAMVRPDGRPSAALRRRTLQAVDLYRSRQVSHILCCGGSRNNLPAEAEVMQTLCREAGVADAAVLLDPSSGTTLENLRNAKPLLAACGAADAVIVTDHFHKWRAAMTARHLGIQASVCCPAATGISKTRLLKLFLREVPALAYYWWQLRRISGSR